MPRGDGTGPMGMGPMTGRGAGYCASFSNPGYRNPVGLRCGLGRRMFYSTNIPEGVSFVPDEKELLQMHAKQLENQLNNVKMRLENIQDNI